MSRHRTAYTNTGYGLEIGAPGLFARRNESGPGVQYYQATYISAAYLSGVAGLIYSVAPELGPAQVRALIQEQARSPAVKLIGPRGLENYLGHGIIHAGKSVSAAGRGVIPPADGFDSAPWPF